MKPVIRINLDKKPELVGKIDNKWMEGNQFRVTILCCWIDFLEKHKAT